MRHHKHHFERVALVYDHVRNTDPKVVDAIIPSLLRYKRPLDVADIGCGTGRYSEIIAVRLNSNLRLYCCDNSGAMLYSEKHNTSALMRSLTATSVI